MDKLCKRCELVLDKIYFKPKTHVCKKCINIIAKERYGMKRKENKQKKEEELLRMNNVYERSRDFLYEIKSARGRFDMMRIFTLIDLHLESGGKVHYEMKTYHQDILYMYNQLLKFVREYSIKNP